MAKTKPVQGNIETAILEVYKKIGYVHKAGEVLGGGMRYAFAKESDFIAAIRPEMIAAGITQRPDAMIVLSNDRIETVRRDAKGQEYSSYQFRVCVQVDYRFTHAASGTSIVVTAFGEGMDSGDKSFNKAMTGANKYALRQAFMVETGDDPDKYGSHPDGGVDTGEPVQNNNVGSRSNKSKPAETPKAAPKAEAPKTEATPAAATKQEQEATKPSQVAPEAIASTMAKIPSASIEDLDKGEKWANTNGVAARIAKDVWGELFYAITCRRIELCEAGDETTLAVIGNKIPAIASVVGVLTGEQRADLISRIQEKATAK